MRAQAASVRTNISCGSPGELVVKIATRSPSGAGLCTARRYAEVVDPAEDDPAHAVPERQRKQREHRRVRDVAGSKPPVCKPQHCGKSRSGKHCDHDSVPAGDWRRLAPRPERVACQSGRIFQLRRMPAVVAV